MDNVIDCEDMFSMMQIENRANRDAMVQYGVNPEGAADGIFRAFMEDHIKQIDDMILGLGGGRKDDDYHPEGAA